MSFSIKGKVITILSEQTGTSSSGNAWNKRDFVIEEIDGQYPKKIAFTVFNKPELLSNIASGDIVTIGFNLESKEYNGKWFTNSTAWKINVESKSTATSIPSSLMPGQPMPEEKNDDDLPF